MEPEVVVKPAVEVPGPTEKPFQEKGYAILGFHGEGVDNVSGLVFRVRFFIDGKVIEEDLPIPTAKTLDELMDELAHNRYLELKK